MPEFASKEDFSTLVRIDDQAPTISVADKLRMEANLLSTGIKQGFSERAQDAWNNKTATAIEFGTAAVIGGALTAMHAAGGRWSAAAKIATYGLAGVAIGDVASRMIPSAMAMNDAWHDPSKFEQSKDVVASRLGSAFFDYPLMAAGGLAGSAAAARFVPSMSHQFSPRAVEMFDLNAKPSPGNLRAPDFSSPTQFGRSLEAFKAQSFITTRSSFSILPIVPVNSTDLQIYKAHSNFDARTFIKGH